MKTKTLMQYLVEDDYSAFMRFAHSSAVLAVDESDEVSFYEKAPENWALTLINSKAPSYEAEKAIIRYQSVAVLSLCRIQWGVYHKSIMWALEEGSSEDAEKIVDSLKAKPAPQAEVAMIRRCESQLFKLWLNKFGELDEEAEKLINEDASLWSLKNDYINWQLSQ